MGLTDGATHGWHIPECICMGLHMDGIGTTYGWDRHYIWMGLHTNGTHSWHYILMGLHMDGTEWWDYTWVIHTHGWEIHLEDIYHQYVCTRICRIGFLWIFTSKMRARRSDKTIVTGNIWLFHSAEGLRNHDDLQLVYLRFKIEGECCKKRMRLGPLDPITPWLLETAHGSVGGVDGEIFSVYIVS